MIPTFSERAGDMRARASLESEKPLNGGTQRVRARAQPGPLDLPAVSALFRGMNTIVGPKKPWPSALPSNGLGRGSRAAGARNALQVPNWLWPSCVHSTPGKCMAAPRTSCTVRGVATKASLHVRSGGDEQGARATHHLRHVRCVRACTTAIRLSRAC